jgi:ankyrin repeat protein
MKRSFLLLSIAFLLSSCGYTAKNGEPAKSKLLGYDYRLFQNTHAWELAQAVKDNDSKKIRELVQKNDSVVNYQEPTFGKTLLFFTMWHNQIETFNLLLSLGANPNIHDTYDGASPLIEACKHDINTEFVSILLQHGAMPNDIEVGERRKDNQTRYTPLIAESENGNLKLVKALVDLGANLNYVNEFGQSALGQAVILKKYEVILYLLKKGADYKIPMYKNVVENKPIYIKEALQNMHPAPNSNDYKIKMEIEDFLNQNK